ncbi:MAG: enoyl-CoA hydratase/isomerase family protein [Thermoplasmata archaeon]
MNYEELEIEKEGAVVTVSLNRPEVHNAMNEKLMRELTDFFKEKQDDESIRTVVLTGKGKSFCAGADLNWMKSMVDFTKEENVRDSRLLLDLYEAICNYPKPVIARVNGHAFGGGIGLISVCDINIAVEDKKFSFSEVKIGITPSVISTFVIRRIGVADAKRLFITGERFTSRHAKEIGLVDFVVPADELDTLVDQHIGEILSGGPKAIQESKNLANQYLKMDEEDYKEFTVQKISELRIADEGQEGITAFLEKRKPKWKDD